MKRNILLLLLMAIFLTTGAQTDILAQGRKAEKDYWKRIEKSEKARDKYYKDLRKQEKKYYKESAKRQRKYYKDLRKIYKNGPPPWAKAHGYDARHHIYFSDYRTFYDPYRGGYVYINGGNWSFSADIPSFLINVDLGRARTRVLRDIPLNRHPEDFYDDYDDDYWDD
ncbi:MAG: hypothetical protein PHV53_02735 [Fermentimonas sp.]|nr:hypothetical protein [Fermentimonas sp.]